MARCIALRALGTKVLFKAVAAVLACRVKQP